MRVLLDTQVFIWMDSNAENLSDKAKAVILNSEYDELAALVEDGQRLTLRKATAMNILMDRVYKLSLDDIKIVHVGRIGY